MKFIKENKIIVFALFVIVLSLGLLAVPGFTRSHLVGDEPKYLLSGYQTFFNTKYTAASVLETKVLTGTVAAGIAAIVMLGVTFIGMLFSKKSSFVMALCGLSLLAIAILFFTMEASVTKVIRIPFEGKSNCGWVTYVLGALNLIASGLVIYKTVLVMKDEIKHPAKPKGPTYNYLKK